MKKKNDRITLLPQLDPRSCDCQLIWANEREVEAEYLHAKLDAANLIVGWLLLDGAAVVTDGEGELRVCKGSWIFPGKAGGHQHFEAGSRILSVRFAFRNRGGAEILPRTQHIVVPAARYPELEERAREMVRLASPWTTRGSLMIGRDQIPLDANLEIEAAFYRWLAVYTRTLVREGLTPMVHTIEDPRVRRALAQIEAHPMTERFRVSELARECGLGVNRLGALFHQATGKSPLAHYETLRLERARHLLSDSECSIKEIAWALGFSSLQHFSNWFKTRTGQSPRDFTGN